jgi:hypothetical protein
MTVSVWDSTAIGRNFDLFWETADCDNDPIAGHIPEPASMLLLCSGLLGLGLLRRHRYSNEVGRIEMRLMPQTRWNHIMRTILVASAALVIGLTNAAMATPFIMGSNSTGSIGDEIGTPFDVFSITGNNGTAAGHQQVATLNFIVGGNCYACTLTPTGRLLAALTVGGVSQGVSIPWSWSSTGPMDTLHLDPIAPLTYRLGGGEIIAVSFDFASAVMQSSGNVVSESLNARFNVPEPVSLVLLGVGCIGIGLVRRKG